MRRILLPIVLGALVLATTAATASADNSLVASGYFHSCGVTPGNAALCWGTDSNGALGNGAGGESHVAGAVEGLGAGVTAVTAGIDFGCAIVAGAAKCWGSDSEGQLGNGPDGSSQVPVEVSGLTSGVTHIAAGDANVCAVVSGGIKCWGRGTSGQLGNGGGSTTTPVDVAGIPAASGATVVETASSHTCAVVSGAAKCWGLNGNGRLGDGTTDPATTPVNVSGLTSGVTDVSVGLAHSCAVVAGAAKCWGLDTNGQVGNGAAAGPTTPEDVTGLSNGVTTISAGYYFTCAVGSGAAYCWGSNSNGQLGGGGAVGGNLTTPQAVLGLTSGVESVGSGAYLACARVSGSGRCWGQNVFGGLGNGSTDQSGSPVGVTGFGSSSGGSGPGPGPGPGAITPAAPSILSAPKKVKQGKKIALKLSCETGCALALSLKIGKKSVKGLKPVTAKPGVATLNLKLPSKQAKQIKAALKKSKKTKIVLTITPSSAQGTGEPKRVSIVR